MRDGLLKRQHCWHEVQLALCPTPQESVPMFFWDFWLFFLPVVNDSIGPCGTLFNYFFLVFLRLLNFFSACGQCFVGPCGAPSTVFFDLSLNFLGVCIINSQVNLAEKLFDLSMSLCVKCGGGYMHYPFASQYRGETLWAIDVTKRLYQTSGP